MSVLVTCLSELPFKATTTHYSAIRSNSRAWCSRYSGHVQMDWIERQLEFTSKELYQINRRVGGQMEW